MMAERGLSVDHSTIARWVLRCAPLLNERLRRHLRHPNRSWRVDETYIRVSGRWTYLYRALDSEGNTIDFMLSPHRDRAAAKHFLQLALWRVRHLRPRVINVDGHPAYPSVTAELKQTGELPKTYRYRHSPCLNNVIEQDHRFIKKANRCQPVVPFHRRRAEHDPGLEAMHIIRKGQIRWLRRAT